MNSYGIEGEQRAVEYLESLGYKILERNYATKSGEIDVIAQDGSYTVFVEVKSRLNKSFGEPSEAVTKAKRTKCVKAATYYLVTHGKYESDVRFDVIEVFIEKIRHIKDAFRVN